MSKLKIILCRDGHLLLPNDIDRGLFDVKYIEDTSKQHNSPITMNNAAQNQINE